MRWPWSKDPLAGDHAEALMMDGMDAVRLNCYLKFLPYPGQMLNDYKTGYWKAGGWVKKEK